MKNLFIEGDNLDALYYLRKDYLNKIKMIYIDPPYNTGTKRQYKDKFTHAEWKCMMYPRLVLAKDLMRDDGVIFISIDDNEVAHLRLICDEIFGEGNSDTLVWDKEAEGKSGTLKKTLRFRKIHEYIMLAYKNKSSVTFEKIKRKGEGVFETANLAVNVANIKEGHVNCMELVSPTGKKWYKHWKFHNDKIKELLKNNMIYWGPDGEKQPRLILSKDKIFSTSILKCGSTTKGRKDYEVLMPAGTMDFPKPLSLIKYILTIAATTQDLILDFFAGSCTTAHAVMKLNAEDGGNRKFIMVQLDEPCDQKSEAYKAGYKTIADIGRERIKRAAASLGVELEMECVHIDAKGLISPLENTGS